MLTFAKAQELLPPGDTVYTLTAAGGGSRGDRSGSLRRLAGNEHGNFGF